MVNAEFFDIFGIFAFLYVTVLSAFMLMGNSLSKYLIIMLLIMGVLGLIIDSTIVIKTYIIKK